MRLQLKATVPSRVETMDHITDKLGKVWDVRYEVSTRPDGKVYRTVYVLNENGHCIAHAALGHKAITMMDVQVYDLPGHPNYRRRGLATAMYEFMEKQIGHKLKPDWAQTPDGEAFWKSRS